ncbi:hypothetical protein BJY04DRAFT_216152 [Aspergillus karnatakaensis]|uniref:uncharacterized protein n=1 Tax=Aspergillus karnatakaensis TaxID=1810916 RepID=UPI003CCCA345
MANYQTDTTARVIGPVFIGIIWGATTLSFLFVTARTLARIIAFRRLWLDDLFAIAAWFILLAQAITWQTQVDTVYLQFQLSAGNILPTPEVLDRLAELWRAQCAILILFYTSLWAIKASFLIFFRRLAGTERWWMIWFWCVSGFVAAAYFACLGDIQYKCLLSSQEYILQTCNERHAIMFQYYTLIVNMVLDVLTDIAIISLPITLLWNARITLRRKLILMSILSLAVVIIMVAIIRVAVVASKDGNSDITWLWMWSFIEGAVANIIVCLASFRQLFVKQNQKRSESGSGSGSAPREAQGNGFDTFASAARGFSFHRGSGGKDKSHFGSGGSVYLGTFNSKRQLVHTDVEAAP